jgi:hypothetical protein
MRELQIVYNSSGKDIRKYSDGFPLRIAIGLLLEVTYVSSGRLHFVNFESFIKSFYVKQSNLQQRPFENLNH